MCLCVADEDGNEGELYYLVTAFAEFSKRVLHLAFKTMLWWKISRVHEYFFLILSISRKKKLLQNYNRLTEWALKNKKWIFKLCTSWGCFHSVHLCRHFSVWKEVSAEHWNQNLYYLTFHFSVLNKSLLTNGHSHVLRADNFSIYKNI